MPVRLFKTPRLVQALLPGFTWRGNPSGNTIYLTFDDGPIPVVTEFVLEELKKYEAKATFFCVGDNLKKYPHLATRLAAAGHRLGNHTFHHLYGWETPATIYLANVKACAGALADIYPEEKKKLFRAPYGSLTWSQYKLLKPDFEIVMWDVLTYDFDKRVRPEVCLRHTLENTKAGSIVVFHDSLKAQDNLFFILPRFLAHFKTLGFRFEAL